MYPPLMPNNQLGEKVRKSASLGTWALPQGVKMALMLQRNT